MEQVNILNSFERIISHVKHESGCYEIIDESFGDIRGDVMKLCSCFALSSRQIILLAIIIDMCRFGTINLDQLSESMKCNFFTFLRLKKDIDALVSKDLLEGTNNLAISKELMYSLESNSPCVLPVVSDLSTKNILEKLLAMMSSISNKRKSSSSLLKLMDRMIMANPSTSIAMACDRYCVISYSSLPDEYVEDESLFAFSRNETFTDAVSPDERILFYILLSIPEDKISWNDLSVFFLPYELKQLQEKCKSGSLELQKNGAIEFPDDSKHVKINLSVKQQALSDIIIENRQKEKYPNIIYASEIKSRDLFYSEETTRQIISLSSLLSKDKYSNVRNCLIQQGLRTGFSALFYGGPGTGKTEGVYQIAKNTNRDIIAVNVSEIKNQYVGESEKNVKEIFESYRTYVLDYGTYPILLFNEADALLGTRSTGRLAAVDKMENSIQNIILQEMENMDGILIATTNLAANLDKAFERRFLYKIHFIQPDKSIRSKIWKSMLPELSQAEADSLAADYNLSGGQIENICRKKTIQSVISDTRITISLIRKWCGEEFLLKSSNIGFALK